MVNPKILGGVRNRIDATLRMRSLRTDSEDDSEHFPLELIGVSFAVAATSATPKRPVVRSCAYPVTNSGSRADSPDIMGSSDLADPGELMAHLDKLVRLCELEVLPSLRVGN